MAKLQCVRGTYDLYGAAKRKTKQVVRTGEEVVEKYGFEEIETPIFEFTEVFARNLGDTSDIVTKEMYCFEDRGGESLTLRPEGTAGVVRAFVSNGMQQNLPVKFYYHGQMFRYERPQKGRQRQFTQFGVELLGADTPQADIEVIAMAYEFLEKLGLSGQVTVEVNSLGDAESRTHGVGQVFDPAHREVVLGDGHRDTLDVGFLEAVLAQALRGHIAGESHHRHRVHIGGGDAGDEVRCARAAGGQHHAGAARCTGVAVRRVGCALLVGGQHMGDAVGVFVQLVVEVQYCAAGVAEEGVHPLLTEHLHKDLRTVQLHGEFLLFPFPFSTLYTFFPTLSGSSA